MAPLVALVAVTAILLAAGTAGVRRLRPWPVAIRGGLAAMFVLTGVAHFVGLREEMVAMVPPGLPAPESPRHDHRGAGAGRGGRAAPPAHRAMGRGVPLGTARRDVPGERLRGAAGHRNGAAPPHPPADPVPRRHGLGDRPLRAQTPTGAGAGLGGPDAVERAARTPLTGAKPVRSTTSSATPTGRLHAALGSDTDGISPRSRPLASGLTA